jgi:hypothetical protein
MTSSTAKPRTGRWRCTDPAMMQIDNLRNFALWKQREKKKTKTSKAPWQGGNPKRGDSRGNAFDPEQTLKCKAPVHPQRGGGSVMCESNSHSSTSNPTHAVLSGMSWSEF